LLTIILCVLLSVSAGYGLARFNIPLKEPLFLVLLSGMMIPYQALLTPLYLLYVKLGLQQTLVGLALIHTALQLPFSIFLMRSSFEAVPRELEEAAVVDGCNSFASCNSGNGHCRVVRLRQFLERVHRCSHIHEQGEQLHCPDHAGQLPYWALRTRRLGCVAGWSDHFHRAVRSGLRVPAEILCVRFLERRDQMRASRAHNWEAERAAPRTVL
jgi:hypothetical protein